MNLPIRSLFPLILAFCTSSAAAQNGNALGNVNGSTDTCCGPEVANPYWSINQFLET